MTERFDPFTAAPRDLMREVLPTARATYIKAWELLADASQPLDKRRAGQARAKEIAAEHEAVASFLEGRAASVAGEDLKDLQHLAAELRRHAEALTRMASVSPLGLVESKTLRPEAVGCGKRYRDPARAGAADGASATASRSVRTTAAPKPRDDRAKQRSARPFDDRGPKVDRSALGTGKHDAHVEDTLDADTRAKLEAMRAALDS